MIDTTSKDYAAEVQFWLPFMNGNEKLACVRHVEAMAYCEGRLAKKLREADWLTSTTTNHSTHIEACKGRLDTIINRAVQRSNDGIEVNNGKRV